MIQPFFRSRFVKVTLSIFVTVVIASTLIIYAQNITSVITQTIGDADGFSIDQWWYQGVNDKLIPIFSSGWSVWIKKTPTDTAYALTISGNTDVRWSVRYDVDTRVCNASTEWSIRYNTGSQAFESCDGTCWARAGWSCNGVCGTASGVATVSYPTANWCKNGAMVDVDTVASDGAYNWSCNGTGWWTSANCSANKLVFSIKYPWCNTNNIVLPNGQSWAACNVWSNIAGTGSSSYGSMFQWGRNVAFPSSWTITTTSWPLTAASASATTSFIISLTNPFDWLTSQDHNLWGGATTTDTTGYYQTVSSTDKTKMQWPCAIGYHVPTMKEWCDAITTIDSSMTCSNTLQNNTSISSILKIPPVGGRDPSNWLLDLQGTSWLYWSSTPILNVGVWVGRVTDISSTYIQPLIANTRASAQPIRCLRDAPAVLPTPGLGALCSFWCGNVVSWTCVQSPVYIGLWYCPATPHTWNNYWVCPIDGWYWSGYIAHGQTFDGKTCTHGVLY